MCPGLAWAKMTRCRSYFGPVVPDAGTARKIALAVIEAHQRPELIKTYRLDVAQDSDGNWIVDQGIPPQLSKSGRIILTEGGGGLAMTIDRCTAQVSQFYLQK